MKQSKNRKRTENKKADIERDLASLFGLLDADIEARRQLSLAVKRLIRIKENKSVNSIRDDWLFQVEELATKVRQKCKTLQEDGSILREELFTLLQSLQEKIQIFASQDKDSLLDPIRIILVCRSFMSSYRLQAQMDIQVVDSILSFLSTLYADMEDSVESSDDGEQGNASRIAQIRNDVEHLGSQVVLDSTPWKEALRKLKDLSFNVTSDTSMHHYERDEPCVDRSDIHRNSFHTETISASVANPVAHSESVVDAVECFLKTVEANETRSLSFLLVVGPEGSGKTFTCDEIEKMIQTKDYPIEVLRPTIPIDFMGASLGETEDIIASIFGLARQCRKCVLLLDDIDQLLYEKDAEAVGSENGTMPHSQTRIISSFLSHMDSLRMNPSSKADHLLIIGTASNIRVDSIGRIDKVFFLEPPNHTERRAIIVESLGVSSTNTVTATLLADLVDCTVGRSRSELVQYCRKALSCCSVAVIMNVSSEVPSTDEILAIMKKNLQSLAPESLRTAVLSDYVDMKVLTARDLIARNDEKTDVCEPRLPLFGNNASQVWNGLRSLIVMPLCQSNALDDMLFGSSEHNGKTVCGGVLLAGQPGCGKSALAYHCASVAASLLPSVTLLDVSCTSLVHKEVGGSERALRSLFVSARAAAPCILLMDGIENIAAVRGHDNTTEGTMDRILSTLLVELDGIESQSDNAGKIAVIGITHNEQWIDPALRRPGRLEKVLKLGNPDFDGRVGIVQQEIDSLVVRDSEKELANFVATRTDGMSGAEVVALCKEARMESARKYIHENIELGEVDLSISREHFFTAGLQR